MAINVIKNTFLTNGINFHLDSYRWFLLKNYPDLCKKLFIKIILVRTGMGMLNVPTYDWDKIFELAKEAGYQKAFSDKYAAFYSTVERDFFDKCGNRFSYGDIVPSEFLNQYVKCN